MKSYKTLLPAYDVSGGDEDFEVITFQGMKSLIVQFYYTSLNQTDHKLRIQESLDGVNFLDSKDSSGSVIEITIDNSLSTDILKVYEFNTAYIKPQFIEGTAGTGTIDELKFLME